MAGFSRYAKERFVYPDPKTNQDAFIAHVIKAASAFPEPPVLYTFSDATYLTIFAHRKELAASCRFVLPAAAAIAKVFDKTATYALARSLQIPTISEIPLESVEQFPVVLKPASSVSWATGVGKFGTAEVVFDQAAFMALADKIHTETGVPPIVQTFIEGVEYGVECLADEGAVEKVFVHRRVRSQSPRGGAATVKEAVLNDPAMVAMVSQTRALLAAVKWTGPVMVEWKLDAADGVPKLMEINGRFWGSLPLPERAGVSFVVGYDVLARGFAAPKARPIKPLTTQHFLGDVRWLWRVLFAKDPLRAQLYPKRLAALGAFLKTTFTVPGDVWRLTDPVPFFMEYLDVLAHKL